MTKSSKNGTVPSMSKELEKLFSSEDDGQDISIYVDDFDRIINSNNLKIKHFTIVRDLDLAVFFLNNRRIIQRPLSSYSLLEKASDQELLKYQTSDSGIHWPDIDADISLRGLLVEETLKLVAA